MDHPLFGSYIFYRVGDKRLEVVDLEIANPLQGKIYFEVPYIPTVAQLADLPELHGDLVTKIIELLNPGSDTAEDGAK